MHLFATIVRRQCSISHVFTNHTTTLLRSTLSSSKSLSRRQCLHSGRSIQTSLMNLRDNASTQKSEVTIQVQGQYEEDNDDHKQLLLNQLQHAPHSPQTLKIEDDAPSNTEWTLLGNHFRSVTNLEISTGFNEELNDEKIPLHWPIERLLISSACAEVFRSPVVLEGRARHLILYLTSKLRFEGPTTRELRQANKEAIARGEAEAQYITVKEGMPQERKIQVVYVPELVHAWLKHKYTCGDDAAAEVPTLPEKISLTTLEVLENDAIDTFTRMVLALPHLVSNLTTLNLRSTNGHDFNFTSPEMFREALPQLDGLETLVLTVGEVFGNDDDYLPLMYQQLPPNLTTLRFRGPVSLAKSEHWRDWIDAFANPEYLPKLTRISFVLDLDYEKKSDSDDKKLVSAGDGRLREAKSACDELLAGVEKRGGVAVEPFHDEWAKEDGIFEQVDERWYG